MNPAWRSDIAPFYVMERLEGLIIRQDLPAGLELSADDVAAIFERVVEVHVEESDPVEKGDLVITLDPKTFQAQVDQASAAVRIQVIAIERQELLIENLEERYERQLSMFEKKLVDEDSFDLVENQLLLARVDLRSSLEALSQAQAAWVLLLPFRLIGITVSAVFHFLKAVLFLPARILGGGPQKVGVALTDIMTGLYAVIGIQAAEQPPRYVVTSLVMEAMKSQTISSLG